jgi:hypothetical protein
VDRGTITIGLVRPMRPRRFTIRATGARVYGAPQAGLQSRAGGTGRLSIACLLRHGIDGFT